jgi:signal transduction histidine kinase
MMRVLRLPLAGFALAMVLVASLIGWTAREGWQHVAHLRNTFEAVDIASYQSAEHVKAAVLSLNDFLLGYAVEANPADRGMFLAQSADLRDWIKIHRAYLQTADERGIMERIEDALLDYQAIAGDLLEASVRSPGADAQGMLRAVRAASGALLGLCDRLAEAHLTALRKVVADSERRMGRLQDLMLAAVGLVLLLGGTLAFLVYRTFIAPLQTQLVERQEKLSALGLLAAGVAHEIRNPLTAIKVRLHSLQRAVQRDVSAAEDVTFMDEEIGRLERIVKEFLLFARPADPHLICLPAADLLREVHAFLEPELAERGIQFELGSLAPGRVRADPLQLKQVLINLVQNAAESLTAGNGVVALRARTGTAVLGGEVTPVMLLEVNDTGPGIPPEVQRRLFDPFFTTKEEGTGLGLAIAARIVQKHRGALRYQTQPQRGTTFSVLLPRVVDDETENPAH